MTRGEGPDGPLSRLLARRGAMPLDWGTVTFKPPEDLSPFLSGLVRLESFDWICFSSPRAVEAVVGRVSSPPPGVRVAAVGPSTAAALERAGWPVHRVPDEGSGEGLVRSFQEAGDGEGAEVFFPASAMAREVIPKGLEALGAKVHRRVAYQMVYLPLDPSACRASLEAGDVHAITFASPSAMVGLRRGLGDGLFADLARILPAAAMGPTTGGALEDAGWIRIELADSPSFEALVDAAARAVTFGAVDSPTEPDSGRRSGTGNRTSKAKIERR